MTSSPARSTAPSSTLSGRSLLSRLKSPLQSKTRNFTEFYIQPDDPHRRYSPGDIISGSVVIKVIKPLRITHLVVSLHGYAQVFKNPNSPGDAYKNYSTTVGSGRGKKPGSYFGNGFASLFEDEEVLCGEGRLGEGVYHFNFELEFPSKGLPSSIDFERGTISYMLTSTLTRPTTISATASCDTKVYLMEAIDVAPVPDPKPRIISLEPISRRARARTPRKSNKTSDTNDAASQAADASNTPTNARGPEASSVTGESDGIGSPAQSDVSFESQMSSGNASGTEYGVRSVNTTTPTESASLNGSQTTFKGKTIKATIDVLKGGFLRGDQIPVKISILHTKHVRSLKGIILTLYRQARVDMHPALPVLPNSKGDKLKYEDYYPKSRTGLGGLSLSSAGSSHLFRKDLSQSFAPLFVDPRTLTAEVKCSVRVPDEAFPTISNVPGAMISFNYFVEVVVDIQGKLTGLDRMVSNSGLVSVPAGPGAGPNAGREDASSSMFATVGGSFVDTDAIRREKGVVSCLFEVIIGTKDSERKGKRRQQVQEPTEQPTVHDITLDANQDSYATGDPEQDYYGYDGYYDAPGYYEAATAHQPSLQPPPAPDTQPEEGLSEKQQIQRAETHLLPSQPPGAPGTLSAPGTVSGIPASAPVLPEDDDPHPPYFPPESSSSSSQPPPPFLTATSSSRPDHSSPQLQRRTVGATDDETQTTTTGSSRTIRQSPANPSVVTNSVDSTRSGSALESKPLPPLPPQSPPPHASTSGSAPDYFPSSSSHVPPTDDKQEMQRRRLEMESSAPPPLEDHENDNTDNLATPTPSRSQAPSIQNTSPPEHQMQSLSLAPSAPMLDEEDEDLVDAVRLGGSGRAPPPAVGNNNDRPVSEALPEYRR